MSCKKSNSLTWRQFPNFAYKYIPVRLSSPSLRRIEFGKVRGVYFWRVIWQLDADVQNTDGIYICSFSDVCLPQQEAEHTLVRAHCVPTLPNQQLNRCKAFFQLKAKSISDTIFESKHANRGELNLFRVPNFQNALYTLYICGCCPTKQFCKLWLEEIDCVHQQIW